jgi:hypothetical protein
MSAIETEFCAVISHDPLIVQIVRLLCLADAFDATASMHIGQVYR